MTAAKISMILGHSLNQREQTKLDEVDGPLAMAFNELGHPGVRVCESKGEGEARAVQFIEGFVSGPAIFTLPSSEFVKASADELVARVRRDVQQRRR